MQTFDIIDKYYKDSNLSRRIFLAHSHLVARFAVEIAKRLQDNQIDVDFIEEAALLHDIGIIYTEAPDLGCYGKQPYISHGVIGAELLQKEALPRHAMVCERHIGVGLTVDDIETQKLPLPKRDMSPQCIEEEIIAYADLFYSKTRKGKKTPEMVRSSLARFGAHKVKIFNAWYKRFGN